MCVPYQSLYVDASTLMGELSTGGDNFKKDWNSCEI
jgi:hypothetical protein